MLIKIFYGLICLVPVIWLIGNIHWQRHRLKSTSKDPFTELLLRPAGESLRLKIKTLEEKRDEWLFKAIVFPLLLFAVLFIQPTAFEHFFSQIVAISLAVGVVGTSFLIWGRHIPGLVKKIRDHELGFKGERYVGEEPNQLIKSGFYVFHDLPFDGFNIDHVIVGRAGVYAVETKTRRKRTGEKEKAAHKVIFDGGSLLYPWDRDTFGLEQAKRNADHLACWLTSATGEAVSVSAVLTLPGWWVDRTGRGAVHVVNPKEIKQIFPKNPEKPLSSGQIHRIAHQIAQKSRLK